VAQQAGGNVRAVIQRVVEGLLESRSSETPTSVTTLAPSRSEADRADASAAVHHTYTSVSSVCLLFLMIVALWVVNKFL